ncbi:uncharacterized protein LOC144422150 isoform X2 [Styela clava]
MNWKFLFVVLVLAMLLAESQSYRFKKRGRRSGWRRRIRRWRERLSRWRYRSKRRRRHDEDAALVTIQQQQAKTRADAIGELKSFMEDEPEVANDMLMLLAEYMNDDDEGDEMDGDDYSEEDPEYDE